MEIERWDKADRIAHLALVVSFIIGFITGLPVYDSELFGWLLPLTINTEIRAFLHHWVLIPLLAIAMVIPLVKFIKRGKTEILLTKKDIKDLITLIKRSIGLKVPEPELGFHHPGEKIVFFAAMISVLTFSITGIIMLFNIGGQTLFLWANIFHSLAAALMLIIITGHFLMAISPSNWSVLKAMFLDGRVSEEWAKKHSKGWLKELGIHKDDKIIVNNEL